MQATQRALGDFLRDARRAKGLTQAELSALIDIHQTAISKWELGGQAPELANLKRLALALGFSLGELDLLEVA